MQQLWGKLWFRILAASVVGPVVMTIVLLAIAFLYVLVMRGAAGSLDNFLPGPVILAAFAGIAWVMMVPPFIAVEIGNRRRKPLPAGLSIAFLALLSGLFVTALFAVVQLTSHLRYVGSWPYGVTVLAVCYAAAVAVSVAILSPFIRRWRQRSATVAAIVETF